MLIKPKTVSNFADLLYKESKKINRGNDEFEKACLTGQKRCEIWKLLETKGLAFIRELEIELRSRKNEKRFSIFKFNFCEYILEDIAEAPFHVFGHESIDALISNVPIEKLDYEAAGRLCQYQDTESLVYLFEKYRTLEKLNAFLMLVYGECVYRNPKVLESYAANSFYGSYVRQFWHASLPGNPTEIEKDFPLVWYARTPDSQGMDNYGFDTIDGKTYLISAQTNSNNSVCKIELPSNFESAFTEWLKESNGSLLTASYKFDFWDKPETMIRQIVDLVPQLNGINCSIAAKQVDIGKIFAGLFFAAIGGGCAYCKMGNSLRARLLAWQTLASIIGADWSKGYEVVSPEFNNWQWFWLEPKTDWFANIMDEIWIVGTNPNTKIVCMLAATDVD